jgi:hypothetical protein
MNMSPPSSWPNNKPRKKQACCSFRAGLLLGLFFEPEDEGDKFVENVE